MKIAVQELPVFTVVLGRIGIAAVFLTLLLYLRGLRLPSRVTEWSQLLLLGFLRAALPITLFVWAGSQIDSGVSGILNSTTPLFTAIVAHIFTQDERLSRHRMVAVFLGMLGVIFLIGPSALQGLGQNVLAQLAVLGATCSYGFAGVYGRRFSDKPVLITTAGFLLTSTLLIVPISLIVDRPWTLEYSIVSVGATCILAIFNTAIAFMVWLTLNLRAGANNTSQVTFLIPIMAILLGAVFLGEQIGWSAYLGLIFILLGLAVAQKRLLIRINNR